MVSKEGKGFQVLEEVLVDDEFYYFGNVECECDGSVVGLVGGVVPFLGDGAHHRLLPYGWVYDFGEG